jgi:TfoX/Sxy family transcriptional regulator of competence genes
MAFDHGLAERIRSALEEERGISEKEMFGGIAFLRGGHMFVGIVKDELMVRVGPERYEPSLSQPHVRPMDFTGKPMMGYVFVAPAGIAEDEDLEHWVRLGSKFVATLPEKKKRPAKKSRSAKRSK